MKSGIERAVGALAFSAPYLLAATLMWSNYQTVQWLRASHAREARYKAITEELIKTLGELRAESAAVLRKCMECAK